MKVLRLATGREPGNVMIWLVVVMLIFAVLGAAMVALFTTSVTSSAVQNDSRRAVLLHESGIRYARSALWAGDFSKAAVSDLNDPNRVYTLTGAGTFTLNVASPWFDPIGNIDIASGEATETVKLGEGYLPKGMAGLFPTAAPFLTVVNYDYIDSGAKPNPGPSARARVTGAAAVPGEPDRIQLGLSDDGDADGFVANRNETLCIAVQPTAAQDLTAFPGSLNIDPAAAKIFPRHGGAFEINRRNFYYERAVDRGTHVELTGIRPVAGEDANPLSVLATDYVILTPRNRLITAEGKSGNVAFGGHVDQAAAIADTSIVAAGSRKADISFEEEADLPGVISQVLDSARFPGFAGVDNTEKTLRLGGTGPTFGAVWFRPLQPRSIGGQRSFCTGAGCLFNLGVRVFFTLEYTGTGEGLEGVVFSLINGNPQKNDAASTGGDAQRSELLGYAGDSRLTADPQNEDDFLDNSGPVLGSPVRGLRPPKIGLEFDNRVNRDEDFERSLQYCTSTTSLAADTRNDPGEPAAENRDAVQYVFWGNTSLDVPCRREPYCGGSPNCLGDPSYDDNRHNAVSGTESQPNWPFLAGGSIENSPAIGPAPDFTVYAGTTTTNFKLYAVRPDGTQRWAYTTAGKVHIPAAASNGSIYFGSGSGSTSGLFHGLTPAGGEKFAPVTVDGRPDTKPAIDSDGNIYICTNDYSSNVGRIYAFRPDGTLIPGWTSNPVPLPFTLLRSAALSPSGAKLIVAATDGRIRVFNTSDGGNPLDVPIDGFAGSTGDPVVVPDGSGSFWIYVRDDFRIYKLNANGAKIWSSPSLPRPGFSLSTAPAVGLGNSVYVGGFDGYLYAVSTSDGAKKWEYRVGANAIQSTPAVDGDGHIYFGSDDDHVYALTDQQTGAAIKWRYPADGQPTYGDARGKPAIHADGTVYIGTTGFRLYAINQFSAPKNFKDLLITSYAGSPVTVGGTSADSRAPVELDPGNEADWLKGKTGKRQWAVRMEVHRAASPVGGSYPYTLKAWVRQCGLEPGDCSRDVLGTFYSDTRVNYAPANRPVQLQQTIQLNAGDHGDFDRFLFGFTSATSSATAQSALIRKFQLSFIRPNDPTIGSDPSW